MTDFIEALGNLLTGLANYQPYRKPRRVFTRKFVVFCVLVAVSGWEYFQDALLTGETTATTLRMPLWIIEFPVFLSFALLALQFLIQAGEALLGFRRGAGNAADASATAQLSKESSHA